MKKKLTILLIAVLVLNFSFVKAEVSQTTIDYLLGQPQDHWVTMGLMAAGYQNPDISYLNDFQPASANDYSKTIIALVAAGQNPYDYNSTDYVQGLEGYFDGEQFTPTNSIFEDYWGLMALRSAGYLADDVTIQSVKNFILDNQNDDYGWSYAPGGDSDTNDTSTAIMALLDAGLSVGSQEIQDALDYLQSTQNDDGGFPFVLGGDSDSASDSWVISTLNKAGISPNSWLNNNLSPIDHLNTLYQEDGSYYWTANEPGAVTLMTAYAAVALSDSYYPVAYYDPPQVEPGTFYLRIEGPDDTICEGLIEATTALDIVENGADICGYEYNIEQTGFGPYLNMIDGIWAEGAAGWLFWVDYESAMVGAGDYILEEGDEVLWAYGEWGIQPMRLSLDDNEIEPGDEVTATVEYYNGESWLVVNEAWVSVGNDNYQTNEEGQATFSIAEVGAYEIYAEKDNFIRTNREDLMVGNGVSQNVGLTVIVNNPGGGGGTLSFIVDISDLDFGTLDPGANSTRQIQITNNGDVTVYLESVVSGDDLFEDNLAINDESWENYGATITAGASNDLNVRLSVPENYGSNGQKSGDLVFWGSGQ